MTQNFFVYKVVELIKGITFQPFLARGHILYAIMINEIECPFFVIIPDVISVNISCLLVCSFLLNMFPQTRADRHVTMFHYTTWSDHGVADPLSLVVFHRHMIRATSNSPGKFIVVHCRYLCGKFKPLHMKKVTYFHERKTYLFCIFC